jgi:hypothetical protein
MTSETPSVRRVFTTAEANAALPLVRAIVSDLAQLSRDVIERRERFEQLKQRRASRGHDVYDQELAQVEEELQRDAEQLQEYVNELLELGVEPKSGPEGLVDFPSYLDGRLVYLCWKLGEPEVSHWHELDAGFRGRQPLSVGVAGD